MWSLGERGETDGSDHIHMCRHTIAIDGIVVDDALTFVFDEISDLLILSLSLIIIT